MSQQTAVQARTVEAPKADRAGAAGLQRKCPCGQHTIAGEECSDCREKRHKLQRWPPDRPATAPELGLSRALDFSRVPTTSRGELEPAEPAMLVADEADALAPGQMRKSEFLAEVRAAVSAGMDPILAPAGRSTDGCPYLQFVLRFFQRRDVPYIERTLRQFAEGAPAILSAADYIPLIVERARRSTETWVATGEISGLPENVPSNLVAGALAAGSAHAPARDPQGIQTQLGEGKPLDRNVRSRMERAFGQSFGHVRIHTDRPAAGVSNKLNASAFTVGKHVGFGAREYRPGTLAGDALIAHELAHTIQQRNGDAEGKPIHAAADGYRSLEADADRSVERAAARFWGGESAGRSAVAPRLQSGLRLSLSSCSPSTPARPTGTTTPAQPAQPTSTPTASAATTPAPAAAGPPVCEPNRPLTWADFQGTPQSSPSAWTRSHHELANVGGTRIIKAVFEMTNSWVQPRWANPNDRSLTGCDQNITACQTIFATNSQAASIPLNSTPSTTCPAKEVANPAVVATNSSECASVLGPECDRVANAESARLLRHEQLHFDIACVLAGKGTAAIAANSSLDPNAILNDVTTESNRLCNDRGNEYDADTDHGCKPAEQTNWENRVQAGLPSVTIPIP